MKVALYTTREVTNNLSHCYLAFLLLTSWVSLFITKTFSGKRTVY